jgi:hypothetical protein
VLVAGCCSPRPRPRALAGQPARRPARGGRGPLARRPSAALQVARQALSEFGSDPRLELLAAEACVQLGRRGDALTHAEQGLAAEDELPDELAGDLSWSRASRSSAATATCTPRTTGAPRTRVLERAAASGNHRADAAFLLVALQDLGNHRDDERQLQYARLLQHSSPMDRD